MITLYSFGPNFGLPDPSPFVTKAEVLLKMAGVPYTTDASDPRKAPKGKLPYICDDGKVVADSTFIRLYIEKRYGVDFDEGLSAPERATAWAFERMCEEHLYWALIHARWMVDDNFDKGPRNFFRAAPSPMRPLVAAMVRRQVRQQLWGHGFGRHSKAEIEQLGISDIEALADFLADKPYLMGPKRCGADATVFAFVAGMLCPLFTTPIRDAAEKRRNLVAYRDRLMARYFPDFLPKNAAVA